MSTGGVTRIIVPPDPPETGTTMTVIDNEGAKLLSDVDNTLPFQAIVFPVQQQPDYGVNAERITVTAVDGDELTFERGDPAIAIHRDLQIAVYSGVPSYDYGATLALTRPAGTTVRIDVRKPSGALAEATPDADYQLTLDASGHWYYRWTVDGTPQAEQHLFVRYSNVLP